MAVEVGIGRKDRYERSLRDKDLVGLGDWTPVGSKEETGVETLVAPLYPWEIYSKMPSGSPKHR